MGYGYGEEMGAGYGDMGGEYGGGWGGEYGGTMLADGSFKDDEPFEGTFCEWNGDEPTIVRYQDGERLGP